MEWSRTGYDRMKLIICACLLDSRIGHLSYLFDSINLEFDQRSCRMFYILVILNHSNVSHYFLSL